MGKLDMTNRLRRPVAPGLALVGDAALAIDPLWGVGCGFAFQSGEWLADSVTPGAAARRAARRRRWSATASATRAASSGHARMMVDYATGRKLQPRRADDVLRDHARREARRALRRVRLAPHRPGADARDDAAAGDRRQHAACAAARRRGAGRSRAAASASASASGGGMSAAAADACAHAHPRRRDAAAAAAGRARPTRARRSCSSTATPARATTGSGSRARSARPACARSRSTCRTSARRSRRTASSHDVPTYAGFLQEALGVLGVERVHLVHPRLRRPDRARVGGDEHRRASRA